MKRYALISDGTSDKVLLKIIDWTFQQFLGVETSGEQADFYFSPQKLKSLSEKIEFVVREFDDIDFIVVHRDAEKETFEKRESEIENEVAKIRASLSNRNVLPVIPVRMTEAWLLFDAKAIANAAGNPSLIPLPTLPALNKLEKIVDPKKDLEDLIRQSCGLKSRGLKKLNTRQCIQLIPEFIEDFSPLLQLPSFQNFRDKILAAFAEN